VLIWASLVEKRSMTIAKHSITNTREPSIVAGMQPTSSVPVRLINKQFIRPIEVSMHQHEWLQFISSNNGLIEIVINNTSYTLPSKHAALIDCCVMHKAVAKRESNLTTAYIEKKYSYDRMGSDGVIPAIKIFSMNQLITEITNLLAAIQFDRLIHEKVEIYDACTELFLFLLCEAKELKIGVPLPRDKRIKAICLSFLANPTQDRNLSDMIVSVGASESTVKRLFKSELGMRFNDWKKQVLLAEAVKLASMNYKIESIAYELGYSSPSSFSAMVRKLVGCTPSQYLYGKE